MITTALVLHLWHMLADGGKVAPSPGTAMSSAGSSMLSGRAPSPQPSSVEPGEGVPSAFFLSAARRRGAFRRYGPCGRGSSRGRGSVAGTLGERKGGWWGKGVV